MDSIPTPFASSKEIPASRQLLAAAICALLGACAQQQTAETQPAPPIQVSKAVQYETKPFPIDTFYTLLVAEVAGNREQYDLALTNYYYQAERTQDAGVAARATRIARFLNARRAALRSAQLWAQLEPEEPEAQLAATAELTLAGELDTALIHAEKALELGGDAPMQSLAATAVGDGKASERELREFQRLAKKYPDNGEVVLAHAMILRADERYDEALAIVRKVQEQHPDFLDAPLLESHLLIDQNKPLEARQLLEKLVRIYPEESRLRLQYARLLIREDLDLAQEQFAELVSQRPNDGNMILSLALIRFETDNLDEAEPLFERLLQLEQHESAAHFYLGGIAERRASVDEAVAHYRSVRPGGDYVQAITQGTELLAAAGKDESNNEWFAELRARHANQSEHFYLLQAELLRKHGRHAEAQTVLDKGLQDHKDSGRLIYAHALASEQLGDSESFEQGIRALLERDPDNANLLNTLGYKLLEKTERLPEASQLIGKALELRPDDPAIIDSMGWLQYRLGNHAEAVNYLQKALERLPDHEIAAHLGEVLWVKGEREQALQVWQRGLKINPESKIIPAAMQRLQDKPKLEQHVSDT